MPKRIKDFTDEEKAAIIARLKRIEPTRVAKEFDTTPQTVAAINNAVKGKKKATKKAPAIKMTKKRSAILARAEEVGVTQAAEEAGISKWTIFQWRKQMKKAGMPVTSLKKKSKKAVTKKEVVEQNVSTKNTSSLELENAILKDKVASLTARVEKLRAAIAKLA